jgi:cbb3-type cytochrome oxidase cytochrome c subunit
MVLSQPRQLYPGAKMPSYAYLPATEPQKLLDFLESLK